MFPSKQLYSSRANPVRGKAARWGVALLVGVAAGMLAGCATTRGSSSSDAIVPVRDFNVQKYMGDWHEIARIDHRFQKGLVNSSAQYSLNADGSVKVINRGFDPKANAWKEVEGKAKFVGDPTVGALKVSFFGPFYSGYNVVDIDTDYRVALVIGESTEYMWILARDKQIPDATYQRLMEKARTMGVDTRQVKQYR